MFYLYKKKTKFGLIKNKIGSDRLKSIVNETYTIAELAGIWMQKIGQISKINTNYYHNKRC